MMPGVSSISQGNIAPIEDVSSCGLRLITEVAFGAKLNIPSVKVHQSWKSVGATSKDE